MKTTTPGPNPINTPIQPASPVLDALLNNPNPADTALVPRTDSAPIHPPTQSSISPFACPSRRNGKIARLPKPVRDVVNRMLALNVPQERIVSALEELGIRINQQNISNWKTRGGYREWCFAQEHATQLRLHQDNLLDLLRRHDAPDLPEIGLQAAATQLSSFFLTAEARQLLAADPREYERRVSMLNRIAAQLKTLQQSRDNAARALGPDHDPDRIRDETQSSLQRLTNAYTCKTGESAKDPDIPHRNLLPNPTELFNFTDRAPADESCDSRFLEFLKLWYPSTPKPSDNPATK